MGNCLKVNIYRVIGVLALGSLVLGCGFRPMYGEHSGGGATNGRHAMERALSSVDVPEIKTPQGTRIARVSVELRNDLIFSLTGGQAPMAPTHRINIALSSSGLAPIVDINSGRAGVLNYTLIASYTLVDIATGKPVVTATTSAYVAYDIPGNQQRFVGERGYRNAEDRAAQVITENIRNRIASYFTAGT